MRVYKVCIDLSICQSALIGWINTQVNMTMSLFPLLLVLLVGDADLLIVDNHLTVEPQKMETEVACKEVDYMCDADGEMQMQRYGLRCVKFILI